MEKTNKDNFGVCNKCGAICNIEKHSCHPVETPLENEVEELAYNKIAKVMEGRSLFGGGKKEECALDIAKLIINELGYHKPTDQRKELNKNLLSEALKESAQYALGIYGISFYIPDKWPKGVKDFYLELYNQMMQKIHTFTLPTKEPQLQPLDQRCEACKCDLRDFRLCPNCSKFGQQAAREVPSCESMKNAAMADMKDNRLIKFDIIQLDCTIRAITNLLKKDEGK